VSELYLLYVIANIGKTTDCCWSSSKVRFTYFCNTKPPQSTRHISALFILFNR